MLTVKVEVEVGLVSASWPLGSQEAVPASLFEPRPSARASQEVSPYRAPAV